MLCLNNWNVFHNQAEKDCSSGRRCGGQSFLRGFYGPLRYEPCTQFINVLQKALHIYFIDGCRVCPLDAQYKVKKNSDL